MLVYVMALMCRGEFVGFYWVDTLLFNTTVSRMITREMGRVTLAAVTGTIVPVHWHFISDTVIRLMMKIFTYL